MVMIFGDNLRRSRYAVATYGLALLMTGIFFVSVSDPKNRHSLRKIIFLRAFEFQSASRKNILLSLNSAIFASGYLASGRKFDFLCCDRTIYRRSSWPILFCPVLLRIGGAFFSWIVDIKSELASSNCRCIWRYFVFARRLRHAFPESTTENYPPY